jgi:tRNA 2-selenouridine synthase
LAARVAHIVETYAGIAADPDALDKALTRLPRHHAKASVAEWRAMAARGEIAELARQLIEAHYDPAYLRTGQTRGRPVLAQVDVTDLTRSGLGAAAQAVLSALDADLKRP